MPKINDVQFDIKRFTVKDVGDEIKVEIVGLVPLNQIDLQQLARIKRNAAWLSLESAQLDLPTARNNEPHPNQMGLGDVDPGDAPMGKPPEKVFIRLLSMPTAVAQLKKAESFLKKLTGFKKLDDLRAEIADVSPDRPVTLRNADGGDLFLRMDATTIIADLAERGAKADWIAHDVPAEETLPAAAAIAVDQVQPGTQWYNLATGTLHRVHTVDHEGVRSHALYAHYLPVALETFVLSVKACPEDEYQEALNDQQLFQFKGKEPAEFPIAPEVLEKLAAMVKPEAEHPRCEACSEAHDADATHPAGAEYCVLNGGTGLAEETPEAHEETETTETGAELEVLEGGAQDDESGADEVA